MSSNPLTIAFAMDPIGGIDIRADTTFVLMLEAQRRGHRILYVDPQDLNVSEAGPAARAHAVQLRREVGRHVDVGPAASVDLDAEVDLVMQRKDPPVDEEYVTETQILALCRQALVLNRPESILAANEKLYAMHFSDLMAETIVTRKIPDLLDFMAKLGGEMIVKPLGGKGGEGVFHVHESDRNLTSILEQGTRFGTRRIMAQRYIPDVRRGDKRILLLEGEPLGAVLRVPSESEVRANLHVGGRPEHAELDEDDRRIIDRLAPSLRRDGLFFVGIDVIGGRLTEVNVTSPTGLQEINALENASLEGRVIDAAERLVGAGKSAIS